MATFVAMVPVQIEAETAEDAQQLFAEVVGALEMHVIKLFDVVTIGSDIDFEEE
jgi:hypothetical protein